MSIEVMMEKIALALPDRSEGWQTVHEVCLTFNRRGWEAIAGGHPAVHIGEWGGDFQGEGSTAEEALAACLKSIEDAK